VEKTPKYHPAFAGNTELNKICQSPI